MVGQQQVGGNFEMCVDCSRKVQGNEIYIGSEDRGGHVYCEECYSKHFKKGDW